MERERQAAEEEGKGARDPSRFAGLRSAGDGRELLRSLFCIASEAK
jgi:hypothetical protein